MATPKLLNTREAAEWLGVSASYLNKLRLTGGGPIFCKLTTRVAYDPADLTVWLDDHKRRSTSDTGAAASR